MNRIWIDPRDKPGLLVAMMRQFETNGHISFEGDLRGSELYRLSGAVFSEAKGLERHSIGAGFDFLVLKLSPEIIENILHIVTTSERLTRTSNIIHLQIAVDGELAFGAYDQFHRECVLATDIVPKALLERLVSSGVIRSFHENDGDN